MIATVLGDSERPVAGRFVGSFELVAHLGRGGMGDVYRAHDHRLGRDVALKFLTHELENDPEALARFRREARAASALNHPHICTLYDIIEDAGRPVLVMEFVDGSPLSALLPPAGLAVDDVLRVGVQLADALAHAHAHGIVHRDLKPANIVVTPEGLAKVLDFGIARHVHPHDVATVTQDRAALTDAGVVAGTLPYLAPEVLVGQPADARSDLWALGVVLYEMSTGTRPFSGATGYALSAAILNQPPSALPAHVPPALGMILQRCLSKDPNQRYASAHELQAALESTRPAVASVPRRCGSRWQPRWRLIAPAAAALVCLIIAYYLVSRGATVTPGPTTLAVLPFQVNSEGEDLRFLGIGIPDAIISRLANIKQLVARPTASILRYEKHDVDVTDVGRALGSEYVVTGIIQRAQDRLRVSVQLVRARDGVPIWGEHYDNLTRADLLGLQDRVAEQVAHALSIRLTAEERARLYRRYTENVEAYELYLRGRTLAARSNAETTRAAVAAFERALQLDNRYALARAGLASSSALMRLRFAPEQEAASWADRAVREAKAALAQDPQLAEAHEALAAVYRAVEYDWPSVIEESRLSLELNASLDQPHYYRSAAFYHLGLFDLAEREVQLGLGINPENLADPTRQRMILALYTGRFRDAIRLGLEVRRITGSHAYDYFLGQAYYYSGERETAEDVLRPLQGATPGDRRAQAILASYLAARGNAAEARAIVERLTKRGFMDHHMAYAIGAAYTHFSNNDEALAWLKRAATTGFPCYPWYERDLILEPLRPDVRFQQFLATLRSEWEKARAQY